MVYDCKEKFSVRGKKYIVTGGAQSLSRGMAEGLLENRAKVVLIDLQKEKLEQTTEEYCKKGYKAHGVASDLSKKVELGRMFDKATELLGGKLGIMIPAAGTQKRYEPWEFPEEMWGLVINVDLDRMWFMCQRATQVIRGKDIIGKTISIGPINSSFGGTIVSTYSVARGAVTQLSKSTASDCVDHNICCNVVTPGYMGAEMCASMSQGRKDECAKWIATGRWGRPEDLKSPMLFLASSASDYLSGAVIPVDGGFLAKS